MSKPAKVIYICKTCKSMFFTSDAVYEHKAMTGHEYFEKQEKWFAIKYRSRTEIIVEMLKVAKHGAKKTKIMYGADMSFMQMNEYLPLLLKRGLLEYNEKTKTYQATDLGIDFLKKYESLKL